MLVFWRGGEQQGEGGIRAVEAEPMGDRRRLTATGDPPAWRGSLRRGRWRSLGDKQRLADLPVGQALSDQCEYLGLTLSDAAAVLAPATTRQEPGNRPHPAVTVRIDPRRVLHLKLRTRSLVGKRLTLLT
jgi:hypothetical protein